MQILILSNRFTIRNNLILFHRWKMSEQKNAPADEIKQPLSANAEEATEKLEQKLEEQRLKDIEKVRSLPAQKVLTAKQHEILLSIKKEELTEADKTRIAWATLRAKHHGYSGKGHTIAQKKKIKAKRKQVKKSRKANR